MEINGIIFQRVQYVWNEFSLDLLDLSDRNDIFLSLNLLLQRQGTSWWLRRQLGNHPHCAARLHAQESQSLVRTLRMLLLSLPKQKRQKLYSIFRCLIAVFQIVSTAVGSQQWVTGWAHWRRRYAFNCSIWTTEKFDRPTLNKLLFYCPHLFYVFLHQVQLLTAPASVSHRHLQGKGGTVPEASLLMGALPAQGAPGEQGPAGRYITLFSGSPGFCVLTVESEITPCSFLHQQHLFFFCPLPDHFCSYPISSTAHTHFLQPKWEPGCLCCSLSELCGCVHSEHFRAWKSSPSLELSAALAAAKNSVC